MHRCASELNVTEGRIGLRRGNWQMAELVNRQAQVELS